MSPRQRHQKGQQFATLTAKMLYHPLLETPHLVNQQKIKETVMMKKKRQTTRVMRMCTPGRLTISKKRIQRPIGISGWSTFTITCSPQMHHKDGNRLQHACQVRKLLEECDPAGDDITFLAHDEGNKVWIDWVVPNLKKKKHGTLKSYMTSLEMFLEYVSKKGTRPHLPVLDVNVKNELFDLGNSLKKWRRCITKETSSQKWDRYLDESEQMLTVDEVQEMMNSKPGVDGRKVLQEAEVAESPDQLMVSQYCHACDLIIFTLTRLVGTRPGALANATIGMFEKAKWDNQKRRKVMLVSSHKREEDGPAPIPLTAENEFQVDFHRQTTSLSC